MWVFFGIDVLEQQPQRLAIDLLTFNQRDRGSESINAALMLGLSRHSGDHVSRHQNHGGAIKPFHYWNSALKFPEQLIALAGIAQATLQPGGTVESDAQLFALCIGTLKLRVRPVRILTDQFDILVSGSCNFLEAHFEWQIAKHGPKHDGDIEW